LDGNRRFNISINLLRQAIFIYYSQWSLVALPLSSATIRPKFGIIDKSDVWIAPLSLSSWVNAIAPECTCDIITLEWLQIYVVKAGRLESLLECYREGLLNLIWKDPRNCVVTEIWPLSSIRPLPNDFAVLKLPDSVRNTRSRVCIDEICPLSHRRVPLSISVLAIRIEQIEGCRRAKTIPVCACVNHIFGVLFISNVDPREIVAVFLWILPPDSKSNGACPVLKFVSLQVSKSDYAKQEVLVSTVIVFLEQGGEVVGQLGETGSSLIAVQESDILPS